MHTQPFGFFFLFFFVVGFTLGCFSSSYKHILVQTCASASYFLIFIALLGADINAVDLQGNSVLMYAVRKGLAWSEIQRLLQRGVLPSHLNNEGKSAIFVNTTYPVC